MLTQTVPMTKTGRLILVRLLAPSARTSLASVRRNLEPFFRGRDPGEVKQLFNENLAALERDGLVTDKPLALTEAGRMAALEFLGLTELPSGTSWKTLKDKYLMAAALGVPATDEARRNHVAKADGLRLSILQSHYNLPESKNANGALDALVRKALDMEPTEPLTLKALKAKVLGRYLKLVGNPGLDEFKTQLPIDAVKASRNHPDELRAAVLRTWLADDVPPAPPAPEVVNGEAPVDDLPPVDGVASADLPANLALDKVEDKEPELEVPPVSVFDLARFSERVEDAARASETGRFGGNKVFISHVWRKLRSEGDYTDMPEAEFKKHLTQANHAGLLRLSRADLVEAMNPEDVESSVTRYHDAAFHFVTV
jgi:hypothetical protein